MGSAGIFVTGFASAPLPPFNPVLIFSASLAVILLQIVGDFSGV